MSRISIKGVDLAIDFVTVEGQRIVHDFEPWLRSSGSMDQDMDDSASKIAWAGALLGLVAEMAEVVDAEYRTWRADEGERIVSMSEKISEYKVKQLIESHPEFKTFKARQARLSRILRTVAIVVRALDSQADTLRSRGANRRAEMRAIGMSTPERAEGEEVAPARSSEDRERALGAIFDAADAEAETKTHRKRRK